MYMCINLKYGNLGCLLKNVPKLSHKLNIHFYLAARKKSVESSTKGRFLLSISHPIFKIMNYN